jgi:DNA-directed RNA polymerase subunit RPC12/RpoP
VFTTSRKCVACGAPLARKDIYVVSAFSCPHCNAKLQAPEYYGRLVVVGSILCVLLAFLLLGFRGFNLLFLVLLGSYAAIFVGVNYLKYIIVPKIEFYLPKSTTLNLRNGPCQAGPRSERNWLLPLLIDGNLR